MDEIAQHHLTRLRTATTSRLGRKDLPYWLETNTFINGKPFSFKGHEYQKQILLDESPELAIRKCAQTGISEAAMRMALGLIMLMPQAFRIGYTFPSAGAALIYSKSRLSPIIRDSPALMAAISTNDLDSAEIKTFGSGKELHFKGAAVGNAAISTTLDMLIHDELSFSDPEIIGDYWSRVLHSQYKWRVSLSTPTFVGDPIDVAFANSRRHWNFCKCQSCNHLFVPNYYENVVIPGWGRGEEDLDRVNANNLHMVRHQEAEFRCPKCDKKTSLEPEHRQWVCENPGENYLAAGYQVQPFDAPTIVTLSDLVIASTKYNSKSKFKQFSLGRPATEAENGLTDSDLEEIGVDLAQSPFNTHVMGIDLGVFSHFMVGGVTQDGTLIAVHYERVALKDFRKRYFGLCAEFRISTKVSDIQPYTDVLMQISEVDQRLFAARFVTRSGMEIYDLKQQDKDSFNAIEGVREISVNKNALFDKLLSLMRPGEGVAAKFKLRKTMDWDMVKSHIMSMKRASAQLRNGEFSSVWQKPADGKDHYFHAAGYLWLASQMRGVYAGGLGMGVAGVSKFKVTGPKSPAQQRARQSEALALR